MKVRLFGGDTCHICEIALVELSSVVERFDYEYIDALADETQTFCDENEVEELPHIQFLNENGDVVEEAVGTNVLKAIKKIFD